MKRSSSRQASEGSARALIGFLWFVVGLATASLLLSLIKVSTPSVYAPLEPLDRLQTRVTFAARVVTIVIFLVWMYRLHADLNQLLKGYPITPRGALARLVIPFYNLWGVWNTFATLGNRLKSEGGGLASWGSALRSWLIGLYITGFASNALHHAVYRQSIRSTGEVVSPGLSLLAVTADLFLMIVWLQMARIIIRAVNYRAKSEYRNPARSEASALIRHVVKRQRSTNSNID